MEIKDILNYKDIPYEDLYKILEEILKELYENRLDTTETIEQKIKDILYLIT